MKLASIITAFALFAIACTSTTTTTTPAPATEKSPTDKADSGTPSQTDARDPDKKKDEETAEDPPTCADEATQQACGQCCAGEHQQGAGVYMQVLTQCVCEADNCATECEATLCAATPKEPDTTCVQCANEKQQNCGKALGQTCGADKDCMAFNQCLQQCANKPAQ